MDFCLQQVDYMESTNQTRGFGSWLKGKRKEKGLTQDQLILRAGNVCTKSYLSMLENNRRTKKGELVQPSEEIVDAFAEALGESVNEARALTYYPPLESEISRDEVADEFSYPLARFRRLSDRGQKLVKRHVTEIVDFVFDSENAKDLADTEISIKVPLPPNPESGDIEPASQTVRFATKDEISSIPKADIEDLRKIVKGKKPAHE